MERTFAPAATRRRWFCGPAGPGLTGGEGSGESIACLAPEADELNLLDLGVGIEEGADLAHRDSRGAMHGETIDPGADGGEGDRADALSRGQREGVPVAVGEVLVLPMPAPVP